VNEWKEVFSGDELCQSLMKEAETTSETLEIHFTLIHLTAPEKICASKIYVYLVWNRYSA